jgi:hypothetical protein
MSGQKPLHFLRSTRFWQTVRDFLDDPSAETLELPRTITSAERDQVRQICKHFDIPFKVFGEGSEKYMVIRKPDFSYFEAVEKDSIAANLAELEHWKTLAISLAIERHQSQQKNSACIFCCQENFTMFIKNCGHLVCLKCGQNNAQCSTCGGPISELVPIPVAFQESLIGNKRLKKI